MDIPLNTIRDKMSSGDDQIGTATHSTSDELERGDTGSSGDGLFSTFNETQLAHQFPDIYAEFRAIVGEKHPVHRVFLFQKVIRLYDDLLQSSINTLEEAPILLRKGLSEYGLSCALKAVPASMSEEEALCSEDPDRIAIKSWNSIQKCQKILKNACNACEEVQRNVRLMANISTSLHDDAGAVTEEPASTLHAEQGMDKDRYSSVTRSDDLDCIICMKLLYKPVTTSCGHTFCRPCFQRTLDYTPSCPACRRVFHSGFELPINLTLQSLLERCFPDEYKSRQEEEANGVIGEGGRTPSLPLFVLSTVLPGETIALNIFEPRYRLMIRRVMEGNKRFGIITVNQNHELAQVGTEVEIKEIEATPDGRYIIEIIGLRRFTHKSMTEMDGYRVAEPVFFFDDPVSANQVEPLKKNLGKCKELLDDMLDKFVSLSVRSRRNQIAQAMQIFKKAAGPEPSIDEFEKFTFWVAAYITSFSQAGNRLKKDLVELKNPVERAELCLNMLTSAEQIHTLF